MVREEGKWEYRKHQQLNFGESDFKQFLELRYQIFVAIAKDGNLETFVTSPLSRHLDEKLKHVHKAIGFVDRSKRKTHATTKYYSEKPESAYVQLRLFTKKSETEKSQQAVFDYYKLDELI